MTKEEESRKKSIQELLQFSVQFRYETSIFLLGEEKSSNFSGEKKGRDPTEKTVGKVNP